jgi:hypothetical protein
MVVQKQISILKPVLPEGGKEARAHAVEGLWSADRVLLPDPKLASWVNDFIQSAKLINIKQLRNDYFIRF